MKMSKEKHRRRVAIEDEVARHLNGERITEPKCFSTPEGILCFWREGLRWNSAWVEIEEWPIHKKRETQSKKYERTDK